MSPRPSQDDRQGEIRISDGSDIVVAPQGNPEIVTDDGMARATIRFNADEVVLQNGFDISRWYVNNVAIDHGLLFEPATAAAQANIADSIRNDIMAAMTNGYIRCNNFNNVTVNVDFSTTTTDYTTSVTGLTFNSAATCDYITWNTDGIICWPTQLSREERIRRKLKKQISGPLILNHRGEQPRTIQAGANFRDTPQNEIIALHLLRSMVAPEVFKKYLKSGCISVTGPSGLTYQIQRKSHFVKVWQMGKLLCTLCVYVRDHAIPPTDEVVTKMLICEYDEVDLWRRANIYWKQAHQDFRSLTSKTIEERHLLDLLTAEHLEKAPAGVGGIRLVA